MRKKSHVLGAVIFGVLAFFLYRILTFRSLINLQGLIQILLSMRVYMFLSMVGSSILGGILPDILDPPFTRYHRSFAHSRTLFFLMLLFWFLSLLLLLKRPDLVSSILYFFLTGYMSHLILDGI